MPPGGAAPIASGGACMWPPDLFGFPQQLPEKLVKHKRVRRLIYFSTPTQPPLPKIVPIDQNLRVWDLDRSEAQVQTSAADQGETLPRSELKVHVCPQIPLPGPVLLLLPSLLPPAQCSHLRDSLLPSHCSGVLSPKVCNSGLGR